MQIVLIGALPQYHKTKTIKGQSVSFLLALQV